MVIRHSQFCQLEQQQVATIESSLQVLFREEFPERCSDITNEVLLKGIRSTADRCQAMYGIDEEDAVTKFVYLTWLLGEGFDSVPENAWIQDILQHRRPGSERMEIVMSGVIHHLETNSGMVAVEEIKGEIDRT